MKSQILFVASIFLLGGCTTVETIQGPDGTPHQLVTCPAVENCYSKATETCGGPYKIINTSTDTSGSDGSTSTVTKMLIRCGQ